MRVGASRPWASGYWVRERSHPASDDNPRRRRVGRPPFDTFNLGDHVGDDPVAVAANRGRLAAAIGLGAERLVWMEQVHSDASRWSTARRRPVPATDALVTTAHRLALVVVTADCVPVLLADARPASSRPCTPVASARGRRRAAGGGGDAGRWAPDPATSRRSWAPRSAARNYEVPAAMADEVEAALPGSRTTTVDGTPSLDLRAGIAAN